MAALSAALAAALLEKLVYRPSLARRLRTIRRACLALIQRDAATFSRVIHATRANNRQAFVRALKTATDVPCRVFEYAQLVQAMCRAVQRSVSPKLQSDLRCAMAVSIAAAESARTLILTNLAWLNDRAYTKQIQHRLRAAARSDAR